MQHNKQRNPKCSNVAPYHRRTCMPLRLPNTYDNAYFQAATLLFCYFLSGDFAVLLRAGMSIKQALVYNCVSSVLAFIGMVIGVFIGNIHGASLWVFVGVAGMFLYIALVDMVRYILNYLQIGHFPFVMCH